MSAAPPFVPGQRYMLPSGNVVQILPLRTNDPAGVACQYVHPRGRQVSLSNRAYLLTLTRLWLERYARRAP